jgi:uncharacterized membrane protein YfcA
VTDLLLILPLLVLTGLVAGMVAGLLGIGGGIVVVPVLYVLFQFQGLERDLAMTMAVASSLAVMVLTTSTSAWTHWKQDNVDRRLLPWLLPGLLIGALLAPLAATRMPGQWLATGFGAFALFMAWRLLRERSAHGEPRQRRVGVDRALEVVDRFVVRDGRP